jgi:hypothetical protein
LKTFRDALPILPPGPIDLGTTDIVAGTCSTDFSLLRLPEIVADGITVRLALAWNCFRSEMVRLPVKSARRGEQLFGTPVLLVGLKVIDVRSAM